MRKERAPLEPPERWAQPFVDWLAERLEKTGYQGAKGLLRDAYVSIAAGHLTGVDYFYEYAVEAYYEVLDLLEEASPLAEPRWAPSAWGLEEEAEALAVFEERLADSSTVLCAEPILAAAVLGAGAAAAAVSRSWRRIGFTGRAGGYAVIARRPGGRRCRILVPGSLYSLALAGLSYAGLQPGAEKTIVVPDPAILRKTVFEVRVAYAELPRFLRRLIEEAAARASRSSVDDACREKGLMAVTYRHDGLLEAVYSYVC